MNIDNSAVIEQREEQVVQKSKKIRRKHKVNLWIRSIKLHIKQVFIDFYYSILVIYVVLCGDLGEYAFSIFVGIFCLFYIKNIMKSVVVIYASKFIIECLHLYEEFLNFIIMVLICYSLSILMAKVIILLFDYMLIFSDKFPYFFIFKNSIVEMREESIEKLNYRGLVIKESIHSYVIENGSIYWEFFKDNPSDKNIYTLLIAIMRDSKGKPLIPSRDLARALDWKHHDLINRLVRNYKNSRTLVNLLKKKSGIKKGARWKLKKDILEILKSDFSLSLIEIRDKLRTKDWKDITIEQIRYLMKQIDLNELYEDIRKQVLKNEKSNCQFPSYSSNNYEVKILKKGDIYRISLGAIFWDIPINNRFEWVALANKLYKASNDKGEKIVGFKELARLLELNNHQDLGKLFTKYQSISKRFQSFQRIDMQLNLEEKCGKLRKEILAIWQEDISLSGSQVQKILASKGEKVDYDVMRKVMRNIDFWKLRKKLSEDYIKGKYSKSSQLLIKRYQELINKLISQLSSGKDWSKAEVDEFIATLPSIKKADKHYKQTEMTQTSKKAWLKCFLFHLPKNLNGKVCCPKCGSFETIRKSRIPTAKNTIDPISGETVIVNTFQFYCKNNICSKNTFTSNIDSSHILEEKRFAKICLMLRHVMTLRGSYRSVANLFGTTKSHIFYELTLISEMADYWLDILGPVRFSGTICIDEKFVKIAEFKKTKKRPFGYLIFAVDPATNDLLHIEIFASRDSKSAEMFLMQLKAKGIYPKVIMTDLACTYDKPVRSVFGRSVTIARCFFHFKKDIYEHMHNTFGKKNVPEIAKQLKEDIFNIVDAKAKKTIKKRYNRLMRNKEEYLNNEPLLSSMFSSMKNYYPHLMRVTENERVSIRTNNPAELTIRHFNQRYKLMAGFKTLETARRHAKLFQIVYRFTPLSDDVKDKNRRGLTPLELAGYKIDHMPLYQYLTAPLLFNIEPVKNLAILRENAA